MEGRMTLCNMSIEAGARAGMIGPDEITFAYLHGRPFAPKGTHWDEALSYWQTLKTDGAAEFDRRVRVCWGTSPGMVVPVTSQVPDPAEAKTEVDRRAAE